MSEEFVVDNIEEVIDVVNIEQWKIDKMVEEIKENNADLSRYKEIMDNRIKDIQQQYKDKENQIQKQNHFRLTTLKQYAMMQKSLKSTKTQFKLPLLSGDIVIKKSLPKPQKPADDKIDKVAKLYPELVEVQQVKKLKWADLKSKVIIQDGVPYDKESGENLSDLVDIEFSNEEVIVK